MICILRSSRPEVFCKKGVLRNFAKFTGKHLCQNLFFNKVAGLRPVTLLKKRLWHRCFPVNFVKFLRTPFFIEHLWWLLLYPIIQYLWTHLCLRFPTIIKTNISITMNLDDKSKKAASMTSFFLNSIMYLEMNIVQLKFFNGLCFFESV